MDRVTTKQSDGHKFRTCRRCKKKGCAVLHIMIEGVYVRICRDCLRDEERERVEKVGLA